MKLGIGFTYLIITGVVVNLIGAMFYHLTHPFTAAAEHPSIQQLAFGVLASVAFYGIGRSLDLPSGKRVLYSLSFVSLLKTLSYIFSNYLSTPFVIGSLIYILSEASELVILYSCVVHLKSLRTSARLGESHS
jgi:hypothetical protein